jgi:hypothetical protein
MFPYISDRVAIDVGATLQVTLMIALPACLVWAAMRSARGRGARNPSPRDDTYNLLDFNPHAGSSGHHSAADFPVRPATARTAMRAGRKAAVEATAVAVEISLARKSKIAFMPVWQAF